MAQKLGTEIHYNSTNSASEERFGWIVSSAAGEDQVSPDTVDIVVLDSDNEEAVELVTYRGIPQGNDNGQWHLASACPSGL